MKIIELTTFFYPVHGGVEQIVLQLSKLLQKDNHQVKVICSDSSKKGKKIRPFKDTIEGIKVDRCRTWFSLSYFHKFYPSLLGKLLMTDFDIIHVHGIKKFESYIALLVARIKGKKVIISTHNPFVVDPKERPLRSNLYIKIHDLIFGKFFLRFFDKFLILSEEEQNHLSKYHISSKKLKKIPNALPKEMYGSGDQDKASKKYCIDRNNWDSIVLSLGRISRRKGLQNLEYSARTLTKTLFLLAGPDDGYLSQLKEIFKNFENVKFLGSIDRNETRDLYTLADIWIIPSLYEPFGVVLIEAMAQGLPCIATNIGGPKEIVKKEFGFLIDPNNQKLIKEKIQLLTNKPKLREKMGKAAHKEARKYSWDKIYRLYINTFQDIIDSN